MFSLFHLKPPQQYTKQKHITDPDDVDLPSKPIRNQITSDNL
jgi:hypothetical protein